MSHTDASDNTLTRLHDVAKRVGLFVHEDGDGTCWIEDPFGDDDDSLLGVYAENVTPDAALELLLDEAGSLN